MTDTAKLDRDIAEAIGVTLGNKRYRVVKAGAHGMDLVGPRGGRSSLVQNQARPTLWCHLTMKGYRGSISTWYVRNEDGSFTDVNATTALASTALRRLRGM